MTDLEIELWGQFGDNGALASVMRCWFFLHVQGESNMSSLEFRNGQYRSVLRFAGRKLSRALKTNSERAALGTLACLDDNLCRVELGILEVPDDVDPISFK
jgi:hypothetical protein